MSTFISASKLTFKEFLGLDSTVTNMPLVNLLVVMAVAVVCSVLIYFMYKLCFRGVVYSTAFNVTVALMVIITAMIVATISSNAALSLGMVGALSIVRFRTAIKDPMDLMFLFWAVAAGIGVGAELYHVVIVGNIVVALAFLIYSKIKNKKQIYLLVMSYATAADSKVEAALAKNTYVLRSKLIKNNKVELTVELNLKKNENASIEGLENIDGVESVSLISYNSDFAQ